jgi:hypothetical protein
MSENIARIITRQAGTTVTNHRFVKEAAGGIVNGCNTQGEAVYGVIADLAIADNATGTQGSSSQVITAGDEAPVATNGDVEMEAGAAVADTNEVMTDNVARAILFVAGGGALAVGKVVNGSSAAAAGQIITVRLYASAQHI